MSLQEIIELRLKPAISEAHLHLARLRYATDATSPIFPLDADRYERLTASEISLLDQMLFRFGKLQDAIGQRLLPAILRAGQEWQDTQTFLDKLNRLEKLGAIPSTTQWIELRDLRNMAMHEYPDAPRLNAANLNRVFDNVGTLEATLRQAEAYAIKHFHLDRPRPGD